VMNYTCIYICTSSTCPHRAEYCLGSLGWW